MPSPEVPQIDVLLPQLKVSPEQAALRASVSSYLEESLPYERVRELDELSELPRDVWKGLARIGAMGFGVPAELGGSDGGAAESLLTVIEVARRYPSMAVGYVLCAMAARTLLEHGTAEQHRLLAPCCAGEAVYAYGISEPDAGTDVLALRTRAHESAGDWRITGRKLWTSMAADATLVLVLCRTDEPDPPTRRASGLSLIAVATDQPGVVINKVPLAGMRGAGTCEVYFDDAVAPGSSLVGERGRGLHLLRPTLNVERLLAAGISLGIGTAALELALRYATERMAFGQPIGAFQAIQHRLVDGATALAGALLLTQHALERYESGTDATAASGMAKLSAAEATARVVDDGMRTMAAMGLARESPMQMFFRDARLQLFSPVSNEMVRNLLGEAMGLPRSY